MSSPDYSSYGKGQLFPTERGTPQGGVASPLLSNILLTPFDREMRRRGYQLTRYADDWVVTCKSAAEARAAIDAAASHPEGTGRGTASAEDADRSCPARLRVPRLQDQAREAASSSREQDPKSGSVGCLVCVSEREVDSPLSWTRCASEPSGASRFATRELIEELNPLLRGWGEYYKKAHVRKLFHRLDAWIVRRIRSHRFKRWRNGGWRQLSESQLYGEYGLVNLIGLIPSLTPRGSASS